MGKHQSWPNFTASKSTVTSSFLAFNCSTHFQRWLIEIVYESHSIGGSHASLITFRARQAASWLKTRWLPFVTLCWHFSHALGRRVLSHEFFIVCRSSADEIFHRSIEKFCELEISTTLTFSRPDIAQGRRLSFTRVNGSTAQLCASEIANERKIDCNYRFGAAWLRLHHLQRGKMQKNIWFDDVMCVKCDAMRGGGEWRGMLKIVRAGLEVEGFRSGLTEVWRILRGKFKFWIEKLKGKLKKNLTTENWNLNAKLSVIMSFMSDSK